MEPLAFHDGRVELYGEDCLAVLKVMPDCFVDAVITDPPYHLTSIVKRFGSQNAAPCKVGQTGAYARASRGFMGQQWDGGDIAFRPDVWRECLRVLKPGGHLASFSGTRTYHRMACAIEDAGFEIRDQLAWTYGSGFPKSHDVSKGIDRVGGISPRAQAALLKQKREIAGLSRDALAELVGCTPSSVRDWEEGRSRAVGLALEWIVPSDDYRARLSDALGYSADERKIIGISNDRRGDGSVYGIGHSGDLRSGGNTDSARQWQGWGTALKPAWEPICLARKPLSEGTVAANVLLWGTGAINVDGCRVGIDEQERSVIDSRSGAGFGTVQCEHAGRSEGERFKSHSQGRFPANLIHDGSPEVLAGFPETGAAKAAARGGSNPNPMDWGNSRSDGEIVKGHDDSGGSAARFFYTAKANKKDRAGSNHPTVKPISLIAWLVRMLTPPGGTVLDPFAGTGTTGAAAFREGCRAVLIEREAEYLADIKRRMELLLSEPDERARKLAKADPRESLPLFGGA